MKAIFQKLRSNRGSSMILALFLMLVAIMVSHTILSAAATAGQNVVQQGESQQAYLTVSSAAEAFLDSVKSFSGKYQRVTTIKYRDAGKTEVESSSTTFNMPQNGAFSKELKAALEHALTYGTKYSHSYTISVEGYEDVYMELTIEKDPVTIGNYKLRAVFSNAVPGKAIPDAPYRMAVSANASVRQTKDERNEQEKLTVVTDTWSFSTGKMERVNAAKKGAAA